MRPPLRGEYRLARPVGLVGRVIDVSQVGYVGWAVLLHLTSHEEWWGVITDTELTEAPRGRPQLVEERHAQDH